MGVKDLLVYLRKLDLTKIKHFSEFNGCVLSLDCSISLIEMNSMGIKHNIVNSRGENINHLQGLLSRFAKLKRAGILPLPIFEGVAPALKEKTLIARNNLRKPADNLSVSLKQMSLECIEMCEIIGLPHITAIDEAERTAAHTQHQKISCGVISRDSDVLVYGANLFLANWTDSTFEIFDFDDIIRKMKFTQQQFVYFCILLGTDYNEKILNFKKAYQVVLDDKMEKTKEIETVSKFFNSKHRKISMPKYKSANKSALTWFIEHGIREKVALTGIAPFTKKPSRE